MSGLVAVSGSFRDPRGRIFCKDGRIFRTVTREAALDFDWVDGTGLLKELVDHNMLVPWSEVRDLRLDAATQDAAKILEHERLDFISFPYEWSFAGLKAAALLHLDIHLKALASGVTLTDATAYNIQFRGAEPIFIDHLSFRPYRDGEFWQGLRQFCEQFLNPLLLRAYLGIPHNAWYRGTLEGIPASALAAILPWHTKLSPRALTYVVLPARFERKALSLGNTAIKKAIGEARLPRRSFENMLRGLRDWIAELCPRGRGKTVWADYAISGSYETHELERKRAFVAKFVKRSGAAFLWDCGCNTGEYAKVALAAGASQVIGFESDPGALEKAFHRASAENLHFLPLYLDAANPSPSQGWNQAERDGLAERRNADGLLALAVIHHLCIGRNISLPSAVAWLVDQAPQGVIEFVPKEDPRVQELLQLREDVFMDYSEAVFDRALSAVARTVHSEVVTESGRRLVWYDRS